VVGGRLVCKAEAGLPTNRAKVILILMFAVTGQLIFLCMDTVTEFEMASTLMEMGGVGFLVTYRFIEEQVKL